MGRTMRAAAQLPPMPQPTLMSSQVVPTEARPLTQRPFTTCARADAV